MRRIRNLKQKTTSSMFAIDSGMMAIILGRCLFLLRGKFPRKSRSFIHMLTMNATTSTSKSLSDLAPLRILMALAEAIDWNCFSQTQTAAHARSHRIVHQESRASPPLTPRCVPTLPECVAKYAIGQTVAGSKRQRKYGYLGISCTSPPPFFLKASL